MYKYDTSPKSVFQHSSELLQFVQLLLPSVSTGMQVLEEEHHPHPGGKEISMVDGEMETLKTGSPEALLTSNSCDTHWRETAKILF